MGGCRCLHPSWAEEPLPLPFLNLCQTASLLPPSWGLWEPKRRPILALCSLPPGLSPPPPSWRSRVALWRPGNQGAADSRFRGHTCAGFRPRPGATPRWASQLHGQQESERTQGPHRCPGPGIHPAPPGPHPSPQARPLLQSLRSSTWRLLLRTHHSPLKTLAGLPLACGEAAEPLASVLSAAGWVFREQQLPLVGPQGGGAGRHLGHGQVVAPRSPVRPAPASPTSGGMEPLCQRPFTSRRGCALVPVPPWAPWPAQAGQASKRLPYCLQLRPGGASVRLLDPRYWPPS